MAGLDPQVAKLPEVVDRLLIGHGPIEVPAGMIDVALHPSAVQQQESPRLPSLSDPVGLRFVNVQEEVKMALLHGRSLTRHPEPPGACSRPISRQVRRCQARKILSMAAQFDDGVARRILSAIMDPDATPADQTVEAIAGKVEISNADVLATLRGLAELDPPAVHRERDSGLDIEFWFAIEPGASAWLDGDQEL
jgi:hypothetical protein